MGKSTINGPFSIAMSVYQRTIRHGGFLEGGYPNSWMVYKVNSQSKMGDLRAPPFVEI